MTSAQAIFKSLMSSGIIARHPNDDSSSSSDSSSSDGGNSDFIPDSQSSSTDSNYCANRRKKKCLSRNVAETMDNQNANEDIDVNDLEHDIVTDDNNGLEAQNTANELDEAPATETNVAAGNPGTIPKRKRSRTPLESKTRAKEAHPLLPVACPQTCRRKCKLVFVEADRETIHDAYWNCGFDQRRTWMAGKIRKAEIKSRKVTPTINNYKRSCSRRYFLESPGSAEIQVCQKFFLSTLGYTSDKVVMQLFDSATQGLSIPNCDKRGKHVPDNFIAKDAINQHIESYHPQASHYRRAHAPKRRYLPCDLSVALMYRDFTAVHPKYCSYEIYRQSFELLCIRFGEPDMDKCDDCEFYRQNIATQPELEAEQKDHLELAKQQRHLYQQDRDTDWPVNTKVYAVDLQKVLLLPMMHELKSCVFTSRLVVLNETFAEVKAGKNKQNYLCVWEESIAGRKKEEIASTFHHIIRMERDITKFIFWLDNCAGQNKNWCLYNMFSVLVNLPDGPETVILKYLIPGHTSMAADSIHGLIEKGLRKKKDVHDMSDLKHVMEESSKKSKVLSLDIGDFRFWKDETKVRTILKSGEANKSLLNPIVEVKFTKGKRSMEYKTLREKNYKECHFLKVKAATDLPQKRTTCRGIKTSKKATILTNLVKSLPVNRREFWKNLPESPLSEDLLNPTSEEA